MCHTISPFAGKLIDKYGSGIVLAFASTIIGICSLGISFITQPWLFYALYVPGRAVFSGPLELGASTAVSNWFTHSAIRTGCARRISLNWLAGLPILMQMIIIGWNWRIAGGTLGIYPLAIGVCHLFINGQKTRGYGIFSRIRERGELTSRLSSSIPIDEQEQSFTVSQALHTRAFLGIVFFFLAFSLSNLGSAFIRSTFYSSRLPALCSTYG
ncbi:MAG: hypothetical protein CM1200mP15_07000 [Dehalococcoidia bacterium]|nr:MAG: hypothetical protein CM1200mP15_07000 [Dehalococcoidia bacterium]